MSTTYLYATCPGCGHPNVHTEKADAYSPWRFRAHWHGNNPARRCPASCTPVGHPPRTEPIKRGSPEHQAELNQHAPA